MKTRGVKVIASILVFVLMFSYFSIMHKAVAVATNDILDNSIIAGENEMGNVQENTFLGTLATILGGEATATGNANVDFDVYLKNNGENVYAAQKNIGEENYLYADVIIKNEGYLKSGTISFNNPNFVAGQITSDYVSKFENNQIQLKQVQNGTTAAIVIPISAISGTKVPADAFYKHNQINFNGIYVDRNGREKNVNAQISVGLMWLAEKNCELETQIQNVIPYTVSNQKYIALQLRVKTQLTNNTLPVKNENIEVLMPKIDNKNAEKVTVFANTTKQINGEENGESFSSNNYTFNATSNTLNIDVQNTVDANGNISWEKNCYDEYIITGVYKADNVNLLQNSINASYEVNSTLTLANSKSDTERTTVLKGVTRTETISESNISNLAEIELETNVSQISKGQIYANYNTDQKLETPYKETVFANVTYADLINKVTITQGPDNFKVNDNLGSTTYNGVNYAYVKKLTISKDNFQNILGTDGRINIYKGTSLVSQIDNSTQLTNNNYEIDLASYDINDLKIETSKPVAEGRIKIELQKAIKGNVGYTIAQMKTFTSLETSATVNVDNVLELENQTATATKQIQFTEPTTTAEFTIDNTSLSTVVTNQNVKLTSILRTDSFDYSLYKNPVIRIDFPSYIEQINVKNIELRFDNKLNVVSNQVIQNTNGTKTLEIVLDGTQTDYSLGAVSKGANIIVTADISLNKFTPSKQDTITMRYTNNLFEEEEKSVTAGFNVVAPVGIVTVSEVSGYAENAPIVTAISEEILAAKLETMEEARNATFNMTFLNNYTNTIDNVSILGRTLFEGNKDIVTGSDLGSNVTIPLASGISASGIDASKIKIYYSENGNATKDLTVAANGWTLTPANIGNVKSYLIVLENTTLNVGEGISFNYNVAIPANMQFNQTSLGEYVVFFNNNLASGTVADREVSTVFGLSTGRGAIIEATLSSNTAENVELSMNDKITYTLVVRNTGTETARNVIAKVESEDGIYVSEASDEIELGDIAAGGQIEKELVMEIDNISEDTRRVETKVSVTSESIKNTVETNSVFNTVVKTYYNASTAVPATTSPILVVGEKFKYHVNVISSSIIDNRENTVVSVQLPSEVKFEGIKVDKRSNEGTTEITNTTTYDYNQSTNVVTINLGTVTGLEVKQIELSLVVDNLAANVYDKTIAIPVAISGTNSRTLNLEGTELKLSQVGIKISQTSSITENGQIDAMEDFKYVFEIENLSTLRLHDVKVKDLLPNEVIFRNIVVTLDDGTTKEVTTRENGENPSILLNLEAKQKARMEVNVFASQLASNKKVTNKAEVYYEDQLLVTSNEISHTILKYDGEIVEIDPGTDTPVEALKRISGQVWADTSKDGIKDENETRMSGVDVVLFDNVAGALVTDASGNTLTQTTGEDGTYTFSGLKQGRYTVIFLYDSGNYSATTYRASNADDTKNSDAIDTKVSIGESDRIAAITEEIALSSSNAYNVDLGLISNPKFDLSLNKVVSKITVQDSEKTESTEYGNIKLAKKDLVGGLINDTTIVVEYKLQVKNEGAIAGFAKKIVDYMPKDMKFNSELNKDWYQGNNGELYNASLANTLLQPGETKELTLILTKKMTENNLGLINNNAEIFESYNDLGLEDCDSTIANKATNEDDYSSADVLITVKTGEEILFIGISVGIIAVITVSAIIIKKKVIR